jgi:hypothetical protein
MTISPSNNDGETLVHTITPRAATKLTGSNAEMTSSFMPASCVEKTLILILILLRYNGKTAHRARDVLLKIRAADAIYVGDCGLFLEKSGNPAFRDPPREADVGHRPRKG